MPHQNDQNAARLREMAAYEQSKAEEWGRLSTSLVPPCGYSHRGCAKASEKCSAKAAALLAGAEALEAVEVAKAALREIAADMDCGCVPCRGQCRSESALAIELEGRQDVATAALARLEGK